MAYMLTKSIVWLPNRTIVILDVYIDKLDSSPKVKLHYSLIFGYEF